MGCKQWEGTAEADNAPKVSRESYGSQRLPIYPCGHQSRCDNSSQDQPLQATAVHPEMEAPISLNRCRKQYGLRTAISVCSQVLHALICCQGSYEIQKDDQEQGFGSDAALRFEDVSIHQSAMAKHC